MQSCQLPYGCPMFWEKGMGLNRGLGAHEGKHGPLVADWHAQCVPCLRLHKLCMDGKCTGSGHGVPQPLLLNILLVLLLFPFCRRMHVSNLSCLVQQNVVGPRRGRAVGQSWTRADT